MNKKILISLSLIAAVSVIAVGGTISHFSNLETSPNITMSLGVVDIVVNNHNPWIKGLPVKLSDMKPCQTRWIEFTVRNSVHSNEIDLWKHIHITEQNDGYITEPECTEGGGDWVGDETPCIDPAVCCTTSSGYLARNDVAAYTIYDMWICYDPEDGVRCTTQANGEPSYGVNWIPIIKESQNVMLDDVNSMWIYLGQLHPKKELKVVQSYHMEGEAGNEYQGDEVDFTIELFAQQAAGGPSAPEPELLGYERCDIMVNAGDSIQTAIDSAIEGDVICVTDGTYNEHIIINKKLTVRSASSPIIDAGGGVGPIVNITANDVGFDGFTVQNASGATVYGINMDGVTGCTVSNCVVKNITGTTYAFGLHMANSDNNTISNITISDLSETGTAINHGAWGAWVTLSDNNTFSNITVSDITAESDAQGVMLYSGADGNSFTDTTISGLTTNGGGTGLVYPVGVSVWSGSETCDNNSFTDTSISGIKITGANGWAAGVQDRGDTLGNTGNVYTNTTISGITSSLDVYGIAVTIGSATFDGGSIQDLIGINQVRGIALWGSGSADVDNITISVAGDGVNIHNTTDASLSSVNYCNIAGNTLYGINNTDDATLDAENNWWGAASGPDDDAGVINGTGDKISTNVDADPWSGSIY